LTSTSSDIDGQIERCHCRLREKIMPQIFERRLQAYTIAKQRRDAMFQSEPSGLSLPVVQRLHDLRAIEQALQQRDIWEQLPNVRSLIDAYRTKKLVWKDGLVTYWSRGSRIGKPKQFQWHEFEKINQDRDGHKGFWVEGVSIEGPASLNAFLMIPPYNPNWFTHMLKIHVRVPMGEFDQEPRPVVLDFLDDTGSQFMHLYEDDLDLIHHSAGRFAPGLGVINGSTAAGWLQLPTVELEARIYCDDGSPMAEWVKIQTTAQQGSAQSNGNHRLSGIWVRHILYTATAPDNQGQLMLSTGKSHLNTLPTVRPPLGMSTVTQTPARRFITASTDRSRGGGPEAMNTRFTCPAFPGTPPPERQSSPQKRQYLAAVEVSSPSRPRGADPIASSNDGDSDEDMMDVDDVKENRRLIVDHDGDDQQDEKDNEKSVKDESEDSEEESREENEEEDIKAMGDVKKATPDKIEKRHSAALRALTALKNPNHQSSDTDDEDRDSLASTEISEINSVAKGSRGNVVVGVTGNAGHEVEVKVDDDSSDSDSDASGLETTRSVDSSDSGSDGSDSEDSDASDSEGEEVKAEDGEKKQVL
ncbi:hypothetical protein N7492_002385, partial [Penicillium capsulatum]